MFHVIFALEKAERLAIFLPAHQNAHNRAPNSRRTDFAETRWAVLSVVERTDVVHGSR